MPRLKQGDLVVRVWRPYRRNPECRYGFMQDNGRLVDQQRTTWWAYTSVNYPTVPDDLKRMGGDFGQLIRRPTVAGRYVG